MRDVAGWWGMDVTEFQHLFVLLVAAAFIVTAALLWLRLHRVKVRVEIIANSPAVPASVMDASHDLKRQSVKLRGGLRRLARSEKPIDALIDAISGERNGNGNGERS